MNNILSSHYLKNEQFFVVDYCVLSGPSKRCFIRIILLKSKSDFICVHERFWMELIEKYIQFCNQFKFNLNLVLT